MAAKAATTFSVRIGTALVLLSWQGIWQFRVNPKTDLQLKARYYNGELE
jgi:hypothetical protein